MKGSPQFLDWRGELGRLNYLKQIFKRLVILSLILGVNIGLHLLVGLEITAETWDENLSLTTIAEFAIMVPIDIRRLNDIGISP